MSETTTIFDTSLEGFERDVIERSKEVPVVVDFWAEWCGPCRMLGPLLEKLATEYEGKFVLAKADTDQLGQIAAAFGVQGIPAVFGLRDGKVVNNFVGVQSEQYIRQWLDTLMPTAAQEIVREAKRLESTDPVQSEAEYRKAMEIDPREPTARIGLARVFEAQGKLEEARAEIAELEKRGFLEPEAEQVKARLTIDAAAEDAPDLESARSEAEANPNDLAARYRLAEALAANNQHKEALEICLDLVERDRQGIGERAKETMLAIFKLLPSDSPLVPEYRRKLSFVL